MPLPALPSFEHVLNDLASLPGDVLLLGVASDGLPVFLDLRDPTPGSLLVVGDGECGKTAFLKLAALGAGTTPSPGEIEFGVVTASPDEWDSYAELPGCLGIRSAYHEEAAVFIKSLAADADQADWNHRIVLLLLDDLEPITRLDEETKQSLQWLLQNGPAFHIWPIVTLDPNRAMRILPWLEMFRTRIFGHMSQPSHVQQVLTTDPAASLDALIPGMQFMLQKARSWLKFWIPLSNMERKIR